MNKSFIILSLLVFAFITSSDALFGQGRRRRRRQVRRKEHEKTLDLMEVQKFVKEELERTGYENAPYWKTSCVKKLSECRNPEFSGGRYKRIVYEEPDCESPWLEQSNCTKFCRIDRTTPGNDLIDCVVKENETLYFLFLTLLSVVLGLMAGRYC